jgi:uncharacterized protein
MKYTIEYLKENNLIIFEAIAGSHSYGTNIETSDVDIRGVFIQPIDDILGFNYVPQVSDETNDTTYYEIGRFLELLKTTNPNICELLYTPSDCIVYKDPIFDLLLENKEKFLSKEAKNSFAGYAISQIKKAKGLNKKINWKESEMKRKSILDFCYVLHENGSILFNEWVKEITTLKGIIASQKDFGLAKIDHGRDLYALYYFGDYYTNIKAGIVSDENLANDVQLTSIPKGIEPINHLIFNKDAYSIHCKNYKEYQTWLKNRNEDRVKMNKEHGKNFDSKNMIHCVRLLETALDIANKKEIIVRRLNIDKLLSIRKGEYDYDDIISESENLILQIEEAFKESSLPDTTDENLINNLLIEIRKTRYNLQ